MREACLEKAEACLESKEPTSLETEPVVVHEEVPKEDATAKTLGASKKRHGDWNLAVRRRGQPKKPTQDSGGPRKNLAAASRLAVLEWHGIRDAVIKNQRPNRGDGKSVPGTMLYK
jgi:hypothetical protein